MKKQTSIESWSDEELMNAYIKGDQQAHHILYSRHKTKLWQYFYRRVGQDMQLTSDLFQEAFFKLHRSRESFKKGARFLPWFYTIAHNLLVDHYRKHQSMPVGEEIETLKAPENSKDGDAIDIPELQRLSPNEQEVIALRFEKNLNYVEVAETMGIGEANARKIFSRAVKKLKNMLGGQS